MKATYTEENLDVAADKQNEIYAQLRSLQYQIDNDDFTSALDRNGVIYQVEELMRDIERLDKYINDAMDCLGY